jgi:hypothetical protein
VGFVRGEIWMFGFCLELGALVMVSAWENGGFIEGEWEWLGFGCYTYSGIRDINLMILKMEMFSCVWLIYCKLPVGTHLSYKWQRQDLRYAMLPGRETERRRTAMVWYCR